MAAFLYQAIGAALAFIIREIFYVPMDYWWGIIVVSRLGEITLMIDWDFVQLG